MSALTFNESYRSVINAYKISGLPELSEEDQTKWKSWLLKSYVLFIAVFNTYAVGMTVLSLFMFESLESFCLMSTVLMLQATTLFLTLFLAFHGRTLHALTGRLDGIVSRMLDSTLGQGERLAEDYKAVSRQVNVVAGMGFLVSGSAPIFFCLTGPVMGYFQGHYRDRHSLPVNYTADVHQPGVFEFFIVVQGPGPQIASCCLTGPVMGYFFRLSRTITEAHKAGVFQIYIVLQIFCLSIPAWQKLSIDCMMLGMYKTYSVFLTSLTAALQTLGEDFNSGEKGVTQLKFAELIEMHQETRRHALDVVRFFSPVVVVYYISIICMVACGVFYQMNAVTPTGLQLVGLGSYMVVTVIQLYMQSAIADEIAVNLDKFSMELYNMPWYRMSIKNRKYLSLMLLAANRPLRITAYSAPTFTLNKETFLAFLVNTLSAYMAFSKIYDLKE